MGRLSNGAWGWLSVVSVVVSYDTWAIYTGRETLSTAFLRASKHPVRRWPVVVGVGVTLAHLFDVLPSRYDPFHRYGALLGKLDRRAPILTIEPAVIP